MTVLDWIVIGMILSTATSLLIARDWRLVLGILGLQYTGVFWLTAQHWPLSMASIKIVTGWMAIAILSITRLNLEKRGGTEEQLWPRGSFFHIFAAGIVIVLVSTVAPRVEEIIPGIGIPVIMGSLILMGLGMLHLGITTQPFRVIIALLTTLSGFEALYAALESAILVAAMLSMINLGLALIGAYLITAQPSEEII